MDTTEEQKTFWAGKTPCWKMRGCIAEARQRCAAYLNRSEPCWVQDTLCKEFFGIDTCWTCPVRKRYARQWRRAQQRPGER